MDCKMVKPEDIFQCQRCGDCCKGYGGTYLSDADIIAISSHVGMDSEEFTASHCVTSGQRLLLKQGPDGYCIFWNGLCSIHPVKPRMCRQWPFLESILKDIANWKAMASCCPGMNTAVSGQVVLAGVKAYLNKMST